MITALSCFHLLSFFYISEKGSGRMRTLRSELKEESVASGKPVKETKKEVRFNRRELEELMGIRRDTYKRVNGSVRKK